MHGLEDAGRNAGMQHLAESIRDSFPGIYVVSVDVDDGGSSLWTGMNQQVKDFAKTVQNDPHLQNGFNAVGFSQGGLIVRGFIQRFVSESYERL